MLVVLLFILTFSGGAFSARRPRCEEECPSNEHYVTNDRNCPKTCANRDLADGSSGGCVPYTGCVCDDGYVRQNDDGTGPCISPRNCEKPGGHSSSTHTASDSSTSSGHSYSSATSSSHSSSVSSSSTSSSSSSSTSSSSVETSSGGDKRCNYDRHAVFKECPNPCPLTCDQPNPRPCNRLCVRYGCECAPGYVLTKIGGKCIRPEKCPKQVCPENERYVVEDVSCIKTCSNRFLPWETMGACVPYTGCICDIGYVRQNDDTSGPCIPEDECRSLPPYGCNGDQNASLNRCPCSATCANPDRVCGNTCDPSGCQCNPGFVLTEIGGTCILPEDCPGPGPPYGCNGDRNASPNYCPCSGTCAQPDRVCGDSCDLSSCVCNPGYVLTEIGGTCVLLGDCPGSELPYGCNGDRNASPNYCPCSGTCAQPDRVCGDICDPSGCQCNPGYVLTDIGGRCIPLSDCPGSVPPYGCNGDRNASPNYCPCSGTCAQPDRVCGETCDSSGCQCNTGYVLTNIGGTCIPLEDCPGSDAPYGCNGERNASPNYCPCSGTCAQPDRICGDTCDPNGCQCNPGYVLTEIGGTCIPLKDCPESDPPYGCNGDRNASPNYCPCSGTCAQPDRVCSDSCDPSSCQCKPGYVLNEIGGTCILQQDCPATLICGPNEEPSDCAITCPPQTCENVNFTCVCPYADCAPGCNCIEGYLRDGYGVCIPVEECSTAFQGCNGDPNASLRECPSACPATCDEPDRRNIFCPDVCESIACECNPGYVLNTIGGKCVRLEECQANKCPDPNASPAECPSYCQPTCAQPDTRDVICVQACDPGGCVCNYGYILDEPKGKCIKIEDCPTNLGCNGDPNAVINGCPSSCPPTCDQPDTSGVYCIDVCDPSFCVCKPGYILSKIGGQCIKPEECPVVGCNGDPNAIPDECPSYCAPTCAQQDTSRLYCIDACDPSGCVCKPGYILTKRGGTCVRPEDCPANECSDPNASPAECPSYCQPTCAQPDTRDVICVQACEPGGCVCNYGYVLDEPRGTCIKIEDCPTNLGCNGDPNAVINGCPSSCPPTCDQPDTSGVICIDMCDPSRCVCKPGYILSKIGGQCIKPEECPGCNGDPNAIADDCPSYCPATCEHPDTSGIPCVPACDPNGCVCKPGYILSKRGGKCIRPEQCPGCNGDPNAIPDDCPSYCPPTCDQPDTSGISCIEICDPSRCVCKPGYILTKKGGRCILPEQCPELECGPNEVASDCAIVCPPQSCDSIYTSYLCLQGNCTRGCNCIDGYLRNSSGVCIPSDQCPPGPFCVPGKRRCRGPPVASLVCGPNEVASDCAITCPPQTCESLLADYICAAETICAPGCNCIDGYLRNSSGVCIPSEQCPTVIGGCDGDPNATPNDCPSTCQPTCAEPDTANGPCNDMCDPSGCVCSPGYIRSEKGGLCIEPGQCPGGGPSCPVNKTYVYCYVGCPTNYCPIDDSRYMVACDPPYPCPSGCACQAGYLMLSYEDPRCIMSSECPPVECTRPNEIWDPSPPSCSRERCEDIGTDCYGSYPGPPRCVCAPGYRRNQSDICIPESECNVGCNGDPNAVPNPCPSSCPATCDLPDTSLILCIDACDPSGCECKPGYILSGRGGKCVRPEECPNNQECNGDRNATLVECPNNCPPTCDDADIAGRFCTAICLPPGCDCKPEYILDKAGGQCISPWDCPGGSPYCGPNKTYVPCLIRCPPGYCPTDDSRAIMDCAYMDPCPAGCACKDGYLMLSYEDPRCILSSECPPVNCTRLNEVWDPNPSSCNFESCEDIGRDCVDSSSYGGPPRCFCKPGYYRNQSDVCVPASECNTGCNGDLYAMYDECPSSCPPTCARPDNTNVPCIQVCDPSQCVCKPGYILTKKGGRCVKPNDCPNTGQCNDDYNATIHECPSPCQATCSAPDTNRPCPAMCLAVGCICNPGYLRLEGGGPCIKPEDCPGGSPTCGPNKTYVPCFVGCPPSYCPTDDSRGIISCAIAFPCRPGCACNDGYLMLSYENPICVLPSECPPVNCTRPNEVWDPNPSSCYFETCDDIGRDCVDSSGSGGPPRCVCKPGYYRNQSDICVPASECNTGCNGDPYAMFDECPSSCPPTCERPDNTNVDCIQLCDPSQCVCKPGYILTKKGGKCVKPNDCPNTGQCNGDYNATIHECPSPCQATCSAPDTDRPCIAMCLAVGCVCNPGYLRLEGGGPCIKPEDCPGGVPTCGANKTYVPCKYGCPTNYCPDSDSRAIVACSISYPCYPGCQCNPGYLMLSYGDQRCVLSSDCPPVECTRPNEVWDPAPPSCLRESCDDLRAVTLECTDPSIGGPRCVCKPGYYRNQDDICVPASECGCNGDPNATPNDCPSSCPPTCDQPSTKGVICIQACDPSGCVCKPGYILTRRGGKCVKPEECPKYQQCNGDRNATYSDCPSACQATCSSPDTNRPCILICLPPGCVCKPGYLRIVGSDSACVKPEDCPGGSPTCGNNQTYVSCTFGCPTNYCPQSDTRAMVACSPPYPCQPGCACKAGYLRVSYEDPRCVLSSECPPVNCTRPNEVWDPTPSNCYLERCEDMGTVCDNNYPSPPRCVCKPGYYRNKDDICIPASECPQPLQCGYNEVAVDCRTICPPQNCEIAYTDYYCEPYKGICEPGCDCLPNHLRNGSGICILNDNCPYPSTPVCGVNEIARDCRQICPPQTCESIAASYFCTDIPCEPGCDCVNNYLRNKQGVCVPIDQCGLSTDCSIPEECIRTCAAPNPENCPYEPPQTNIDGCECMEGYILESRGGRCIKIEDCPRDQGCNGDLHAITTQCPLPCPSTCNAPDASPCKKMCEPIGCECEPGYMIDRDSGKCVLPDDCPGGNPCGENEEFRDCKTHCPNDYCPVDDSRQIYVCDIWPRCLPGCVCKLNYKRLSYEDDRCIVASDCPPVNCTRQNEVWSPCPSECFSGYCEDREYQDVICNTLVLNCQPKCICKRDTFRNASDICVPASECPPLKPDCPVPENCIRTCASPNPPDCPYDPPQSNIDGCACMEGYILDKVGGQCIKIEDCPKDVACNGDPNAQTTQCPAPCPSTCQSPDEVICYKLCEPIGCECKPGYLLSNETGQCILPDQCPGGDPCGPNGVFVPCRSDCPRDYCPVDDSRDVAICDPTIDCPSGCVCKLNHRWLSQADKRCIVSSDCPPVECTRQNEVWDGCPSDCFSGYCEDREYQDAICYTLVLNCQPKCVCKRDTFRNASDICVPASECPPLTPVCTVPDNCIRTCASPNPPDCPYEPSETNIDGCNCMDGYILDTVGGKCIRIEDCPKDVPCSGDPNAQPKQCPAPCPSTCDSPDAIPCRRRCDPIGCECKPGYMLSNSTGTCILPKQCPGGNPCGPNAVFVPCKVNCPTNYCPVDDSRDIVICDPSPSCLSGCVCRVNYKRRSIEDRRCILASKCPPVICTRPNEVWNKCPSPCLAERCEDIDNQPCVCNTLVQNCQPRCICKKNFFRNATDICVTPEECEC